MTKDLLVLYLQTMSSVTHFTQYLSKKILEKNKEQSTIYNYLRCFCHEEEKLNLELFENFYRKALLFPHWQNYLTTLQKSLIEELKSFAKLYYPLDFDLTELNLANQWQWITIQKEKNLVETVNTYLTDKFSNGDHITALPLDKNRVLGLVLKLDGHLEVFSFGPLALIYRGKIEPVSPLSHLHYSSQYELKPAYKQVIEDLNLNFIHFTVTKERATGYQCHSFCFKEFTSFKQKKIKEIESLFYLLKKIESLFIQAKSDPHYQALIQSLHNHYRQILTTSSTDHSLETEEILSQAKKALKHLYPQDRLLFLLTANIDFHFRKQKNITSISSTP